MVECPRCGGEMREGEAFVRVTTYEGRASSGFGIMGIPGMGIPSAETVREEKVRWRERTGEKKGWLIKREEEKVMRVSGLRCLKCGYIELYARE